jgi:large subunit ribosomal protein L19
MSLLKDLEKSQIRSDLPAFKVGDTIRVYSRIKEGEKERVQYFEGIVIGFHRNAVSSTFKVRKESYGVGVERTYPMHSPLIEKIVVKKKGDVRRAKLFFLREVSGKKARIREKKDWLGKKGVSVPAEGTPERPVEETSTAEAAAAPEKTETKE